MMFQTAAGIARRALSKLFFFAAVVISFLIFLLGVLVWSVDYTMKKIVKRIIDTAIVPVWARILYQTRWARRDILPPPSVVRELLHRAVSDSADYADQHMAQALCASTKEMLRSHAFSLRATDGLIVEFGGWTGNSIIFFASLTEQTIYGLNSFEGPRKDWQGWQLPMSWFEGVSPPVVPANVKLIKGRFHVSLPIFLVDHPEPFSFVHIDCDTYEATSVILKLAGDRFRKGTVVVFDEYFGYRNWRMGEFKAWQEFTTTRAVSYQYLGFSDNAVSLIIT